MHGGRTSVGAGRAASRGRAARLPLLGALLVLAALPVPASAGAASPELFGVTAVSANGDDFRGMGQANVGIYRMLLHWPEIQRLSVGLYDWSRPDREIAGALSNGMEPVPFVYGSPKFAASDPHKPPLESEAARRAWQSFLAAAVRRYGPGGQFWLTHPGVPYRPIQAWQIWNEQNSTYYWGGRPSAQDYARLLELSHQAITSVDPGAQILLGGLYGNPRASQAIPMRTFLRRLYRIASAPGHFDALALHPYGRGVRDVEAQIADARQVMDENGDSGTGIWITEIGWSTAGPEGHRLVTTTRGQARKLRAAFQALAGPLQSYGIERVVWFVWRDFHDPVCTWCGGAGLLRHSGGPKPSLSAYTRFTGGPS